MNSRVYEGALWHERLLPQRHAFQYPVSFFAFDLNELSQLSETIPLFSYNRFNVFSLHDADYLERGPGSIREKLDHHLRRLDLRVKITRVVLITCARFLGHVFNPISFYYCYDQSGKRQMVVAEVSNTFDERHLYFLTENLAAPETGEFHATTEKAFHVSPFFDRNGVYHFKLSEPADTIDIHLHLVKDSKPLLLSRWQGSGLPLSQQSLLRMLRRFPMSALLTLPRIHWQAAKLYFGKKLPHFKKPPPDSAFTIRVARPRWFERIAMRLILRVLSRIQKGTLTLELPLGSPLRLGGQSTGVNAVIRVQHYQFFWRILKDAGIGLGEGYMYQDWSSPDPAMVLQLLIANKSFLQGTGTRMGIAGAIFNRFFHLARKNSLARSRKNIRDHYDLSNSLFATFLDSSMTYSSAYFRSREESLESAQQNKLMKILKMADIRQGHDVLEIGCGWGSFACVAVKTTGCRVTGLSLSEEQLAYARTRASSEGLSDNITLLSQDYRLMEGQFDRIVSIEMLEAVGHEYLDTFFAACNRLLKPGGRAVIQVITIPHARYESYRRGCDWIQKHIFPGGHLPSMEILTASAARGGGFSLSEIEDIGLHYAHTLRLWKERFSAKKSEIRSLGFDETFILKWLYYFNYCEAAFASQHLHNMQFILTRSASGK